MKRIALTAKRQCTYIKLMNKTAERQTTDSINGYGNVVTAASKWRHLANE